MSQPATPGPIDSVVTYFVSTVYLYYSISAKGILLFLHDLPDLTTQSVLTTLIGLLTVAKLSIDIYKSLKKSNQNHAE